MKIGLDFDGVIADCGRLKSEVALQLYGVKISPENFKKELVTSQGLLTLTQYRELQSKIYSTRQYGLQMSPVPGVFKYLSLLVNQHEIQIVTSRGEEETQIAQEWQDLHYSNSKIGFTSVGYENSKVDALKGFDVFVDDDLDKIEPLVGIVPHRFLFSWGYNQHIPEGSIATRISSWEELYQHILSISN